MTDGTEKSWAAAWRPTAQSRCRGHWEVMTCQWPLHALTVLLLTYGMIWDLH